MKNRLFIGTGIQRFIALMLAMFLTVMMIMPATGLVTKTEAKADSAKAHFIGYTYYYNDDGSFNAGSGEYTVNGKRAYCIEHAKNSVFNDPTVSSSACDNEMILKILYYGLDGVEPWEGNSNTSKNGYGFVSGKTYTKKWSDNDANVIMSMALSRAYSGSSALCASAFYNWVSTKPAPFKGDPDIYVEEVTKRSNYNRSTGYITSKNYRFKAKSADNYAKVTIPQGYIFKNITRGFSSDGSKMYTATIYPDEVFSVTKMSADSGTIKINMIGRKAFSATIWTTGDSNLQNLVMAEGESDADRETITLNFEAPGDFVLNKLPEDDDEGTCGRFNLTSSYNLANAKYGVYNDAACKTAEIAVLITDSNGMAESPKLNSGTYYVKEKEAPEGFVLNEEIKEIKIEAGKTGSVNSKEDAISGRITIEKKGEGNDPASAVKGAVYGVYYNQGTGYANVTLDKTLSDDNNVAYNIVGVYGGIKMAEFTIDENGKGVVTWAYPNQGTSVYDNLPDSVKSKTELTNNELKGTAMKPYSSTWEAKGLGTYSLGGTENGGNLPRGSYTLVELKAPDNGEYNINTAIYQKYADFNAESEGKFVIDSDAKEGSFLLKFSDSDKKSQYMEATLIKKSDCEDITTENPLYGLAGSEYTLMFIPKDKWDNVKDTAYGLDYINSHLDADGRVDLSGLSGFSDMVKAGVYTVEDDGRGKLSYVNNDYFASADSGYTLKAEFNKDSDTLSATGEIPNGYLMLFETKLPDSGAYGWDAMNTYAEVSEKTLEFSFVKKNPALTDPISCIIRKESTMANSTPLDGAVFEYRYYSGYYGQVDTLPEESDAVWYFETKIDIAKNYVALFLPEFLSVQEEFAGKSSALYYSPSGLPALPLGTFTIKEVKAPKGYQLDTGTVKDSRDHDYTDNDRTFIAQVRPNGNIADIYVPGHDDYPGTIHFTNRIENDFRLDVNNAPKGIEFSFTKVGYDAENNTFEKIGGINFLIEQLKLDDREVVKSHVVTTDQEGSYDSKTDSFSFAEEGSYTLEPGSIYRISELMDTDIAREFQKADDIVFRVDMNEDASVSITKIDEDGNVTDTETFTEEDMEQPDFTYNLGSIYNVKNPEIGTFESDLSTSNHITVAENSVQISDTVFWNYLDAGKSWTVKGILMKTENGKAVPLVADGKYVTASSFIDSDEDYVKTYSKYERKGYAELTFSFDASELEGTVFTVYEYLFEGRDETELSVSAEGVINLDKVFRNSKGEAVCHAEFNDVNQTGYIPKISTSAVCTETGSKLLPENSRVTVRDTVTFGALDVNAAEGYVLYGELVDAKDDKTVYASSVSEILRPQTSSGTFYLDFSVDTAGLKGKKLTVYEYLYLGASSTGGEKEFVREEAVLVASHAVASDKDQSVYVPEIGTKVSDSAYTVNGNTVDVEDEVAFKNLINGEEYTLFAKLVDAETGETVCEIAEPGHFVAVTSGAENGTIVNGSYTMSFSFDPTGYFDKTLNVYEYLYAGRIESRNDAEDAMLLAVHADINDTKQSFRMSVPIEFEKIDENGNIIGGALMQLTDANGSLIEEWTSVEGMSHIAKLSAGKYVLSEVRPPTGYFNTDSIEFEVTKDMKVVTSDEQTVDKVRLGNREMNELPVAGGNGTKVFTIAGLIMMLGGLLLTVKKTGLGRKG